MYFRQILDSAFQDRARKPDFSALLKKTDAAIEALKAAKESGERPLLALPEREDDLAIIEKIASELRKFSRLVVIGAGGASLGGQALCSLKRNPAVAHRVIFLDNIDPTTTDALLKALNLKDTAFLTISKSGATAETLSQALAIFDVARKTLGGDAAKHFFALTTPGANPLRDLAARYGWPCFEHDPKLGGRFSVLSLVGLIPAAVEGVDLKALRKGALSALNDTFARGGESEAAKGAALMVTWMNAGYDVNVFMPYADNLRTLGLWYLQLWSESIGKDGKGSTPALAIGATDQHSQLQLYLGGPRNKSFTLLLPDTKGKGLALPAELGTMPDLNYLAGHTLGNVMEAEQHATATTLIRHKHPVRIFEMNDVNEESFGALLMHFMLETILSAPLMGVNAFDQPAVEEGKQLVRDHLSGAPAKEKVSHG